MAKAVIGALRVALGIDTAQFMTGLKQSQTRLAAFGKAASVALAAVATAAAGAAVALGAAVKRSADHADELGKMAQKVGVSVEALSRLEYAGRLADVSLEQLGTGLRKLSQNMLDLAAGRGQTAKTAFDALGIAVKDANGQLRASDVVLAEVADKFARMEDGSTKTALAVSLFGRSGAELIPLLNEGKAGLAEMAAEADRLGVTISTKTAKSAEAFNDNLTRLSAAGEGLANKIMEAVIPSLADLSNTVASPEFQSSMTSLSQGLGAIASAIASIVKFGPQLAAVIQIIASGGTNTTALRNLMTPPGAVNDATGGTEPVEITVPYSAPETPPFVPIITGAKAAKKELIELTDTGDKFRDSAQLMSQAIGDGLGGAFSRLADAVLSGNDALSATVDVLMDLGKQLVSSAITGFFGNLFGGGFNPAFGLGSGAVGRGVYGGSGGFFPGFPGLAGGTDNWRGGMTWVGENGPELLNLPRGSQVIPNHELGRMGESRIRVDLGPGLVAQILQQAEQQSVQIVKSQAPLAVARFQQDRKGG
jgi:hypothetical protein